MQIVFVKVFANENWRSGRRDCIIAIQEQIFWETIAN